jgi:outer membrane protein
MKRLPWFAVVLLGFLLSTSLLGQNKQTPLKLGFVNVDAVVQAHSDYDKIKSIRDSGEKELKPVAEQIKALQVKLQTGSASAKEQQDYQLLTKTFQDTQKKWNDKVNVLLEPVTKEIDGRIDKWAKDQGFALLMDRKVAQTSGLVIYADESTDVTDAVVKLIKK